MKGNNFIGEFTMDNQEFKNYNDMGNWDFSDIKYYTEQECSWDFYNEINKYSNKNSLILDLGTGGGEECLANMPDVRNDNSNRFFA